MCASPGFAVSPGGPLFPHSRLETGKILLVRVAEGLVKIFQHGGAPGVLLHGRIAVPHRLGHLALAHVGAGHLDAGGQIGLHPVVTLVSMFVGAQLLGVLGLFGFPIGLSLLRYLNETGAIRLFKTAGEESQQLFHKEQI